MYNPWLVPFETLQSMTGAWMGLAARPGTLAQQAIEYWTDAAQRTVLLWDTLRQRGNIFLDHEQRGKPPVLSFDYEMLLDARTLTPPSNYFLVRILPGPGQDVDDTKRPFVIVDPRAGHGPGVGGSKADSQIGMALRAGHPCYFVGFYPDPVPGQTLGHVAHAEAKFLETIIARHPQCDGKPAVLGNCQAGWAVMGLCALRPELAGPIILSGSPLSYWAGVEGGSPMRYLGGLTGGSWMASLAGDLGNGTFDGALLVSNFESGNLANTYWSKLYNLYARIDTEPERYLPFEKWWGGFFRLTAGEMRTIVNELFVGNKLTSGQILTPGEERIDLKRIQSPILVFASFGDDITPPQQALNWIADLYDSVEDIRAHGQTIIYILHRDIGHLGIFVSGKVAKREHAQFVQTLDQIDMLPPGLYEMIIREKVPGEPGADLVPGEYIARFEERTLDDVRAIDDTREDERRFAAVARVSEINEGLYLTFVSPWVRAMVTEYSAELLRWLNPKRLEYAWWSDWNPLLAWLPGAAETVRKGRKPVAPDNAFLLLEKAASDAIAAHLRAVQGARDQATEGLFKAIYDSPWLQAAIGLNAWGQDGPARRQRDPAHEALVRERTTALHARLREGGPLEAAARMLIYLATAEHLADHRSFRYLESLRPRYPRAAGLSREELKTLVRDQMAMLQLDEDGALAALPEMLDTPEQRQEAMDLVREVSRVRGEMTEQRLAYLHRLEVVLGVPKASDEPVAAPSGEGPAAASEGVGGQGAEARNRASRLPERRKGRRPVKN
jgi:hypothetical protein